MFEIESLSVLAQHHKHTTHTYIAHYNNGTHSECSHYSLLTRASRNFDSAIQKTGTNDCSMRCCALCSCVMLWCVVLCCTILCCTILCCAMVGCAILCYAMLCYAVDSLDCLHVEPECLLQEPLCLPQGRLSTAPMTRSCHTITVDEIATAMREINAVAEAHTCTHTYTHKEGQNNRQTDRQIDKGHIETEERQRQAEGCERENPRRPPGCAAGRRCLSWPERPSREWEKSCHS